MQSCGASLPRGRGCSLAWLIQLSLALAGLWLASPGSAAEFYRNQGGWVDTMLSARTALIAARLPPAEQALAAARIWAQTRTDFPVQWDWALQDAGPGFFAWFQSAYDTGTERGMILRALNEQGDRGQMLRQELEWLVQASVPANNRLWLELYVKACEQRRQQRLWTVLEKTPRIIFTRHRTVRPSSFASTEAQSDGQGERLFLTGADLCLLEMRGLYGRVRPLLSDPSGVIRDPAVSWDGQRVLFAWKKSLDDDDYHLYELDLSSRQVRQITSGDGVADYEPAYLPNDDIVFASTRCVQTIDCGWSEVSNLYACNPDGYFLRRLGFDQAHTLYPQVLDDGRVIYTRWEFNDRSQVFSQPLFQMGPDGAGQAEFYGVNSGLTAAIVHARGIPGARKVLAVLCNPRGPQVGQLAVIDPARGPRETNAVQLVAPIRKTSAARTRSPGQAGGLWQYPYPLNARECLVTYAPLGWDQPGPSEGDADFGLYWMDLDGRRELLASDPRLPCSQPVPLAARPVPLLRANRVDHHQLSGTFYLQDIYAGPGLAGVPRGTIKKLRIVAFDFRPAGLGHNGSRGPAGEALVSTPISVGNGAWDVKFILGEAAVHEDGSAMFIVPARVPVYFQALDERGCAVQTMRSWSTLQPGEYAACVGCHEHRNTVPPTADYSFSLAMKAGAKVPALFYGPPRAFSFPAEIQPVLDRHCTRCHKDRAPIERLVRGETRQPVLEQPRSAARSSGGSHDQTVFSLLGEVTADRMALRKWSDAYLVLTQSRPEPAGGAGEGFRGDSNGKLVNWIGTQSTAGPLPPYAGGAARSRLLTMLEEGHQEVKLSREELRKLAAWIDLLVPYCGDYQEANAWTAEDLKKYQRLTRKRREFEKADQQSINDLIANKTPGGRPAPLGPIMRGPSR
jgi:hypothetical protein